MKRLVAASIGVLAIGMTTASAADIRGRPPVYRAPPPAPPPIYYFSWTGCYFGGHIGGLWARKEWTVRDPADPFFGQSDGSHRADGFLGGVRAGWSSALPAIMPGPMPTAVISAHFFPAPSIIPG